jgi:hypothetical protein
MTNMTTALDGAVEKIIAAESRSHKKISFIQRGGIAADNDLIRSVKT